MRAGNMDQQSIDAALRARADKVIPGGMWGHQNATRVPAGYPQYFSRGEGCRIWDADGRSYIDYMCAWGPMILGYGDPDVEEAAARQRAQGDGLNGPTPRLVELAYSPRGAKKHLALVGKGITFDSGGLSIKPAQGMGDMKSDMAGAAAVLHTVLAAAALELPVKVTGWLCLAENMPSGTAQRPSDVITQRGGTTVEVLNTDAEGRLVLADGLVAAREEKPDTLVDIATLTGAQMVALGPRVSAVMGTDETRAAVVEAAARAGEQFWPMPLPVELRASLSSKVADLANIGDRMGGMLVAGLFLKEFVGDTPWAHLDIAGPAFNEAGAHGYTPVGGTGVGVRTLLSLLEG